MTDEYGPRILGHPVRITWSIEGREVDISNTLRIGDGGITLDIQSLYCIEAEVWTKAVSSSSSL